MEGASAAEKRKREREDRARGKRKKGLAQKKRRAATGKPQQTGRSREKREEETGACWARTAGTGGRWSREIERGGENS